MVFSFDTFQLRGDLMAIQNAIEQDKQNSEKMVRLPPVPTLTIYLITCV